MVPPWATATIIADEGVRAPVNGTSVRAGSSRSKTAIADGLEARRYATSRLRGSRGWADAVDGPVGFERALGGQVSYRVQAHLRDLLVCPEPVFM